MQKLLNRLWPWTTLLPHLKERNSFPWLYPNISLRPAALGKPQTPFVFTEPKQLHAEKVGVPARDEVLRGRDTDPKLKNPHPASPLTRSENSRADNLSVPLVPYEATGNSPSPVESSSFRNPALAPRTQPAPAGAHTHSHTHPPTHTLPSSPAPAASGETGREPWSPQGAGCNTFPRQEPLALLLLPPQHRDMGQENDLVPCQHHLKAPLPQPSHSISTLSGRPARC